MKTNVFTALVSVLLCSSSVKGQSTTPESWPEESGYHKAIVMTNATDICLLDIRAFVGSDFRPKCIYSVRGQTAVPGPVSRRKRQVQPTSQTTSSSKQDTSPAVVTTPQTTTTTTTTPTPTVPPGAFIEEFDMDMANRIMFFATADNTIYKRPIDALIDDEAVELMVKAAGNIGGLAYDAEDTNNLYWCESDTGNIWVINTVSRAAKNITPVGSGIRTARDIIVILNKRMLAMITGEYPDMSLQTMTMVDRKLNVLVSGKSDIAAFTYDSEKQIFYYISSRSMYSVPLDGGESAIEFDGLDAGINSLVLYQHYLVWSYENGTGLGFKTHDLLGKTTSNPIVVANTSQVDMKILDILQHLVYQCNDVIQQTVMLASGEEAIIDINMDLTCSRYLDGECNYRCPMNFEPTFETLLTCTNVGWDVEPNILCKVKESQKSELSVPGVVTGFGILGVLVIGLVVLGIVLFRRKMTSSTYTSLTTSKGEVLH